LTGLPLLQKNLIKGNGITAHFYLCKFYFASLICLQI
jgi:hypothetical protein